MSNGPMLAGRLRRLLATAIDVLLVPSLTLLLVLVTGVVEHAEDYADNWWVLHVLCLAILSYLLLNGYLLATHGQTLGKKLCGIALATAESGGLQTPPWWKLILIRAWFFPLLFLVFVPWFVVPGLLLVPIIDQLLIFTKTKRCLHDYAAGTLVVRVS